MAVACAKAAECGRGVVVIVGLEEGGIVVTV